MKFHFFHLMPYPELPADFREKNRSVWVDVPSKLFDPAVGHRAYNEYLDELEYAASVGFDGICVNEHHQNAYGLMPSPNLMAAALARRTSGVKLVLMGNSVALYNPPTRVAEEMAMLDVMSGGRLVAGFPVGTPMDTTYCYGQSPATLREKYREGVELILRAWSEPDVFSFNGKYTQLRYVNIWPRPMQKPRPPVWVPGGASVETWDLCLENDFLYANLSYFGYQEGQKIMDGFWNAVDRHKLPRNPYRAGFLQFIAVADSDAEAERLYAEPALYFYRRCLHVYAGYVNPPGYMSMATLQAGIEGQVAAHHQPRRRARRDGDAVVEGSDRARLSRGRQPGDGRRSHQRHGGQAQRRPSDDAAALRQHVEGDHDVQHADVRREGHPAAAVRASANGTTTGFRATSAQPQPLRRRSVARGGVMNSEIVELAERTPLAGLFRRRGSGHPLAARIARRRSGRSDCSRRCRRATASPRRSRPASTISTSCRGSTTSMSWRSTTTT